MCPVCRKPLVVLEWDTVEVDYCLACQGIWLDAGELEILFGDEEACEGFLAAGGDASPRAHGEKRRRCPACDATMVKALTGGKEPVLYDRCHRGHGLWFDRGELQEVLRHGVGSNRVDTFLRGMFDGEEAKSAER
jgi:Zn-finger nucleic acid-binding protein